jgi:hypothetical protein
MNIAKNMESIFVAAVVVVASVANAIAEPAAPLEIAAPRAVVSAAPVMESPLITIVVVGKRLTAEQKAKRA